MKRLFAMLVLGFAPAIAQQNIATGIIKGTVLDYETKMPLVGAHVLILSTQLGAGAGLDGQFTISNVPVGSYTLRISHVGYETMAKTDVIVRSQRMTTVDAELVPSLIESEGVTVRAGYFMALDEAPISTMNFSAEEIRRAPGAAGDISRIISGLPSLAKTNDERNSLIVRGGSPSENGFYVDNIEIPNLNHFPDQGSSGGPIGLLNVDFIRDVNFYTGGFSAKYGDRLSSVMDISLREGNREEADAQFDFNFGGVGAIAEGPLGKGSWLLSAKRSYLDLIIDKFMSENVPSQPSYGDFQGKLVYDLSKHQRITLLNIFSIDESNFEKEDAVDDGKNNYGDFATMQNTGGINWRFLWGEKGYSNTSISHTLSKYDVAFFQTRSDSILFDKKSLEQEVKLRNVNYYRLNSANKLECGVEARIVKANYDDYYERSHDLLGNVTPALRVDKNISATKWSVFATYHWNPFIKLAVSPGIRLDRFSFNKNFHVSPRLALTYHLTDRSSLNAAAGIFYQSLPMILLSQKAANRELADPQARHLVFGVNHLLTESTRLSVELYDKQYEHLPLNPAQPSLCVIDQAGYQEFFLAHDRLVDNGKATARGVEVTIQKKLARDFYGMISGSYFRSRYRDVNGVWRDRIYDNRFLCNIEGGYKPNSKWEFSVRWTYAGGAPYTPFDGAASHAARRGIFDQNKINAARLPAYHSLKLRADRRFHFEGSNLIFYLDLWNVYGRKNIFGYAWNEVENQQEEFKAWTNSTLPIFGVEYEF